MADPLPPVKILFLPSNPAGTARLRLDQEARTVGEVLKKSKYRDRFSLIKESAVRPIDIQQALLEETPQIIHFCGHGEGDEGLIFENDWGGEQLVTTQALADLFSICRDHVDCVLLNACFSEFQAEGISAHVPCVVGMSRAIGDRAAIEFSRGFYTALGAGRSYEDAFRIGRSALLMTTKEGTTPVLIESNRGRRKAYAPPPPQRTIPPGSADSNRPVGQPPRPPAPQPSRSRSSAGAAVGSSKAAKTLVKVVGKTWYYLVAAIAVWIVVGALTQSNMQQLRGSEEVVGFASLGALSGALSGLASALAWQKVFCRRFHADFLLLWSLAGTGAGALIWAGLGWRFFDAAKAQGPAIGLGVGMAQVLILLGLLQWQVQRAIRPPGQ